MAASTSQLVAELRRELPAPVAICRDAITSSKGDLRKAYDLVVHKLCSDLVSRTGVSRDDANELLNSVGFDIERAVELWRRDNPLPAPTAQEQLTAVVELAASIPHSNPTMRRYAHVIPRSHGYEIRLITHLARYTEKSFGLDYDYAMQDSTTRVQRSFVDGTQSAIDQLANWGCTEEMLVPPATLDSCLVNSPIDSYLDLPHLQLDDATDNA